MKSAKEKTQDGPRVKPVSQVKRGRSFVIYGRSGTGKTTLGCSFPGDILLLDIRDEGTDSVADVDGLMVSEIESFEDAWDMYFWLLDHPKRYKTIILDTVSQLQSMAVQEYSEKNKKKGKRNAGDWGTLSQRDWGDIAGQMKELLIAYRDLSKKGMNVVFIAQDRAFNFDDDEGDSELVPEIGPALSPAVAKTLNAAVNVIGNTFIRTKTITKEVKGKKKKIERIEYCLRIGPNPLYVTKVRKPKSVEVSSFISNPTYDDLLEVITSF
ncbi:MAG: AAA family ATPase [Phycisphaerales bacterium]